MSNNVHQLNRITTIVLTSSMWCANAELALGFDAVLFWDKKQLLTTATRLTDQAVSWIITH